MAATDTAAALAATNAAAPDATKSDKSRTKLAKDLDTFLTLLTTQLKHQDPLSPMDSTEFTNQLVQFANVEQQIQANSNLENLIDLNKSNGAAMAVGYIGQTIEAESTQVPLQNGQAQFSYALTGEAKDVTLAVMDDAGQVVFSQVGETTPGKHVVQWDGTDAYGNQLPDGNYRLNITPVQAGEDPVDVKTTAWGSVTGVRTEEGQTYLNMGGTEVDLGKVHQITEPLVASTGTGTP